MRISDWSSDVCSSDLRNDGPAGQARGRQIKNTASKRRRQRALPSCSDISDALPPAGIDVETLFEICSCYPKRVLHDRAAPDFGVLVVYRLAAASAPARLAGDGCTWEDISQAHQSFFVFR